MNVKKVCVIGAGAAGLCAARHLATEKDKFEFDVFEKTGVVGGTWNYTDCIGTDENGLAIHTSMYKHMRTNLPMEIMIFPDFPTCTKTSFVHHTVVLEYLQHYAKKFDLYQYIQFYKRIAHVKKVESGWQVDVECVKTKERERRLYDAVCVCNGRYSRPRKPAISGLSTFPGRVLHSHDYRSNESFAGQTVLVLGAGPSGIDIALELADVCKNVVLVHHLGVNFSNLPENITQENRRITRIEDNKVYFEEKDKDFEENSFREVDALIFATGYHYDFSFLDDNCGIKVSEEETIEGLYLHLINMQHPSMAFWSIPNNILPFPLFHQQVLFFIKLLKGEIALPSREEMLAELKAEKKHMKSLEMPERHLHKLCKGRMWKYEERLCELGKLEPLKEETKKFFTDLGSLRQSNIGGYKDVNFVKLCQI